MKFIDRSSYGELKVEKEAMMNVLMIETFSPENLYAIELSKSLSKIVNLTLLCRQNASNLAPEVHKIAKLYGHCNNKILAGVQYTSGLCKLTKEIKSDKYDIIHIQAFGKINIEAPLFLKKVNKRAKIVLTVHNVIPHEKDERQVALYSRLYSRSNALIVHNEYSKDKIIDLFGMPKEKIFVIPHGAYSFTDSQMNSKKYNDGKIHYLMFGQVRRYKGVDILLKAIAKIPKNIRSGMYFVVAGKRWPALDCTDYIKMAESLGINDCVKFLDRRIEDEELPDLFEWADACIFPYREIYGSGALLMAYSFDKPVIASSIPAFIEETDNGNTGMLFKSQNSEELANAIIAFQKTPLDTIKNYRSNIKHLVMTKYNWDISAQLTKKVYNHILSQNSEIN